MTTCLHNILRNSDAERAATTAGTHMHDMLQRIVIGDTVTHGNRDLIEKIKACDNASFYFHPTSKTEVPVAGTIGGRFISRRIDRMRIEHASRQIHILDYKTDLDTSVRREKYITQLKEYAALMRAIYPDYTVTLAILWTHEWRLEKILK